MEQTNRTIFVCDDNSDNCELIKFAFQLEGYKVTSCDNLDECLSQTQQNNFEAIILDNRFGQVSSLDACREIRGFNQSVPIIFYSGEARTSEIEKSVTIGRRCLLSKAE